jgi:hypothetical protein
MPNSHVKKLTAIFEIKSTILTGMAFPCFAPTTSFTSSYGQNKQTCWKFELKIWGGFMKWSSPENRVNLHTHTHFLGL